MPRLPRQLHNARSGTEPAVPWRGDGHGRLVARRVVLKSIGGLVAGAAIGAWHRPVRAFGSPSPLAYSAVPDLDEYLAPFPAKRTLLAAQGVDTMADLKAATAVLPPTHSSGERIVQVSEWPVGAYPNYCDAAVVGQGHYVWVASYGDESVTRFDSRSSSMLRMPTGDGTFPLDVAHDSLRDRIVVASADDGATMIVLDAKGNILVQRFLAQTTGLGASDGGAQGVAIDSEGNYWFSLAYHGLADQGVLIKVNGNTLEPVLTVKDMGLHNPNGMLFVPGEPSVIALSDNGYAHRFSLDGALQQVLVTVPAGYRGAISGGYLWVAGWTATGKLARIELSSGQREVFTSVPLANSVTVDHQNRVWVAGDAGLSVSNSSGSLIAASVAPSYSNGLTTLNGRTYHTAYKNTLRQVAVVSPRVYLASMFLSRSQSQ